MIRPKNGYAARQYRPGVGIRSGKRWSAGSRTWDWRENSRKRSDSQDRRTNGFEKRAEGPRSNSISSRRLYLAIRSLRLSEPH
jgi:hypothetical protein